MSIWEQCAKIADDEYDNSSGSLGYEKACDRIAELIRASAAAHATVKVSGEPAGQSEANREAIARIVDPNCFWDDGAPNSFQQRKMDRALIKADAILALFATHPTGKVSGAAPTRSAEMSAEGAGSTRETLRALSGWCAQERSLLGAVDGYNYSSGQEYGLRRAEIEIEKRLRALPTSSIAEVR